MFNVEPIVGDRYCHRCGWGPCFCNWSPLYYVQPPQERDPDLRKAALEALKRWDHYSAAFTDDLAVEVAKAMDALREALAR